MCCAIISNHTKQEDSDASAASSGTASSTLTVFMLYGVGNQAEFAVQAAANAEVLNDDVHRRLDGSLSFFAAANL